MEKLLPIVWHLVVSSFKHMHPILDDACGLSSKLYEVYNETYIKLCMQPIFSGVHNLSLYYMHSPFVILYAASL